MTALLRVRLLGDVVVLLDGEPVETFGSSRLQSLLTFLVLHRAAPQPRERLAYQLWPDSTDGQARTNLRKLLHSLRRTVPEVGRYVDVGRRTVQWRPDAPAEVDVVDFEDGLAEAEETAGASEERRALERALAAYGGDLLPASYEDWVLAERERLRGRAVDALERLTTLTAEDGDSDAALATGERLLRLDPLHEATYRRLMRLRAGRGERAQALRIYHTCESVLERELGVGPSRATRDVYASLVEAADRSVGGPRAPERAVVAPPLVGRDQEWKRLWEVWQDAAGGIATAVVVSGEQGIGKSRLVAELARAASGAGARVARARAYEAEGRLAWGPVTDWLGSDALRGQVERLPSIWLTELARLVPEVRLRRDDVAEPAPPEHGGQRIRLFQALAEAFRSADEPLLLVLDDLQWCDADTLELVHYLLRRDAPGRTMVAATVRLEEVGNDHPAALTMDGLRQAGLLVEVALERLDEQATGELARELAGGELPAEARRWVHRETQGNPHFVVEAVRAGLTGGRDAASSTVQALLQRRIDQLSPDARVLVEAAAVIGQEFPVEVLAAVVGRDVDSTVEAVDELWRRRIVREQGPAYDFDHDRLRAVAYAMVSPARRRRLHHAVARAVEQVHAGHLGPVSARLAVHYEQAGLLAQAVTAHRRAAEHSLHVLAIDDALVEARRALDLLRRLPAERERDALEFDLRMIETVPTVIRFGYADPATERSYEQVLTLARSLGRSAPAPALRGLATAALASCRLSRARELGENLLVAGADEPAALVEGHYVLGVAAHWTADFATARAHLSDAVERSRSGLGRGHITRFAQDPEPVCRSRLGWTLWCLGQPQQALSHVRAASASARRIGHPLTSAYVGWSTAVFAAESGETDLLRRTIEESAVPWTVNPLFAVMCPPLFTGWVQVVDGDRAGLETLRKAVSVTRPETRALLHALALVLLARGCLAFGQAAEAWGVVEEARSWIERRGQHYFRAEVDRLAGEAASALGDPAAAEQALHRSLDAATAQGFRAYELRAACSLVRHRRDSGTLARLRQVSSSFGDEDDTVDLREAARLLS